MVNQKKSTTELGQTWSMRFCLYYKTAKCKNNQSHVSVRAIKLYTGTLFNTGLMLIIWMSTSSISHKLYLKNHGFLYICIALVSMND